MSSLFQIGIENVSTATTSINVDVVHPDQWDISGSKNFALQIVIDAFWSCKMGYLYDNQPLAKDAYPKLAEQSPIFDELDHLLELMHGRKEIIDKAEYDALSNDIGTEGLTGWGSDGTNYHKHFPTNYNAFCREAERIIKSVRLVNEENNPRENEDDPDPRATIEIEFFDENYTKHLVPGTHWDSAIYDFKHYQTIWFDSAFFEWSGPCPDFDNCKTIYDVFEGEQENGTPDWAAFSKDGKTLLLSSQMGEVVAIENGDEKWRIKPDLMFYELSVRNDLVVLHDFGTSKNFSIADGAPMGEIDPDGRVASFNGTYQTEFGEDETLSFLDGRKISAPDVVEACAFSKDESKVAIGGMFNEIIIADPASANVINRIQTDARCGHLAFSPDGKLLAAGIDGTSIEIYDVEKGTRLIRKVSTHFLISTAWSPDGSSLLVAHVTNHHGYDGYFVNYPVIKSS